MIKPIDWFLITLQHTIKFKSLKKGLKVYPLVVTEQKRRVAEGESPFESLWTVQIKSFFWRLTHKWKTGYSANILVGDYYGLIQKLVMVAEHSSALEFFSNGFEVRLAGATIVIGEMWAINGAPHGIYVHRRFTPQSDWELVYRTNWLMKDTRFIGPLRLVASGECIPRTKAINNTFHATINADIN